MAKLTAPLLSFEARKSLAKTITYVERNGLHIAERIPTHADARTYLQYRQRLLFWAAMDYWHSLSDAQRAVYETAARPRHMTGWADFLRQYLAAPIDIAAWWNFDEVEGAVAGDRSQYAAHGTIHGATHVEAILGWGLDFVTDDYVEVPAVETQLDFTDGDFSIVCRVKVDTLAASSWLINRGAFNADGWYWLFNTNNSFALTAHQGGAHQDRSTQANAITLGQWHTLGTARTGAALQHYVDGLPSIMGGPAWIDPATSARSMKIGIRDDKTSGPFDGAIDLIIIFTRLLSADEQEAWHNRFDAWP